MKKTPVTIHFGGKRAGFSPEEIHAIVEGIGDAIKPDERPKFSPEDIEEIIAGINDAIDRGVRLKRSD